MTLTVLNVGTSPLTVSSISVPTGFATSLSLPITLEIGNSIVDLVCFTPDSLRMYNDSLAIESNGFGGTVYVDLSGVGVENSHAVESEVEIKAGYYLKANYPNPFNSSTTISFSLSKSGRATLEVFDVTGRIVKTLADDIMTAGEHQIQFDGTNLSSWTYFARIRVGNNMRTEKLVLLR